MNNFLRIIQIIRLFIKYDVDKMLVDSEFVQNKKYFYLFPWNWMRTRPVKEGPKKIRLMFEELGPIFVKLGQVISTRKDLLSKEIAEELANLQDRVKPFPSDQSKQIIEKELQKNIKEVFSRFDDEPLASASIAQVHSAQLKDGSDVIVKVVRPNIKKDIEKDIRLMKIIARYLTSLSEEFKRMHLIEVVNDYEILVYDETNLMKESLNAKKIKENFHNSKLVYIPEIFWEYVTKRVLIMERTFATPINDRNKLVTEGIDFNELATSAVELFFIQVFEHNFFHADMHPGNIFIQQHKGHVQFVLVDFGIMGSLSAFDKKYLAENFVAFFNRDYEKVARLHVECEWVPRDTNVSLLETAIRDNCESMLDKPIKDVSLSEIILGLFDTARRFKLEVQPQLVLMQKTLLYTEGLGREFSPDLDLWKTSKPILEKWMRKQKGLSSILKRLQNNSYDLLDILPDLPQIMKRLNTLVLSDKLSLEKNIDKLKDIEVTLHENSKRNYKSFLVLLVILLSAVNYYIYALNIFEPFYFVISIFVVILLFSMRPRRKSNVE